MNSLIEVHGAVVEVWKETKGVEDLYGDREPTWVKLSSEKAWIQTRRKTYDDSVAGRFPECECIGFFKASSPVAERNYVLFDSVKYEVVYVDDKKIFNATLHKEVFLKIMVE